MCCIYCPAAISNYAKPPNAKTGGVKRQQIEAIRARPGRFLEVRKVRRYQTAPPLLFIYFSLFAPFVVFFSRYVLITESGERQSHLSLLSGKAVKDPPTSRRVVRSLIPFHASFRRKISRATFFFYYTPPSQVLKDSICRGIWRTPASINRQPFAFCAPVGSPLFDICIQWRALAAG